MEAQMTQAQRNGCRLVFPQVPLGMVGGGGKEKDRNSKENKKRDFDEDMMSSD